MKRKRNALRDTWTRWPLLAGDVHVPEWSLEDEVKMLAIQCLRSQGISPIDVESADLEDSEGDLLTSHVLSALTESAGRYLSTLLALLAAYRPSTTWDFHCLGN